VKGVLVAATTIALRGATLIDGTGSPPVPDSLLVLSQGRIVSVGRATGEALAAFPPGAEVINVSGKWIIPGLIDAHVHAESEAELKTMLRWGVTSARLMAEDVAAAQRLATGSRGRTDIPEVFPAAPIFTARDGWWDQGEPPDANLNRFPATPEAARVSVRTARALGAAEIKVMLDDMGWCRAPKPALPRLPPAVFGALVSEARAEGMRVSVHAPNLSDAKAAIAGGATALAHGVLQPLDEKTVALMKSRPVFYLPTMGIFEFLANTRRFVEAVLSDPRAAEGLEASTVARYRSGSYSAGYRESYPAFENVERHLPALRKNLLILHRAGVPIALGTDMWAFPGLGVSVEMDLYVQAGLSPSEAIRAATRTAAESLGLEDRGTLGPGMRADFLILDADPLADVRNVRSIRVLYKAGVRVGFPITR
jgi:imidazolonepropionase-like amidohydrolase